MRGVPLESVVQQLDEYLRTADVPDYDGAQNGLQVANRGDVTGFVTAVDASQRTIDRVASECAPGTMLVVHHGLFWDRSQAITGRRYRRVKTLLDHDIALYSSHIPLDVHPVVGNNVVLAKALGILDPVPFDSYRGVPFGAAGPLITAREMLVDRVRALLGTGALHLIPGGPEKTKRVGVITGAAGDRVSAAAAAGIDTFVTGEGAHHTTFDALELGVNLLYAGHYATETVGVRALGEWLHERFGLHAEFHDHPTGM